MTTYTERAEKQKTSDQRAAAIRLKNNRLGMNIFQVSWIMAFVALIVVNWQLRFNYSQWPPAGVPPFDLILPSVATLALLISSALVVQALKILRRGLAAAFLVKWRLAIGLGALFLAVIVYEFLNVSDAAMATQYGNTFRLMTGFHFVHALAILAIMCRVYQEANQGKYSGDEHDSWAVEGAAKLWYFVTFAWMLFYLVLYWIR
ncbi:MAG: cytochrome c oxidase subunit 3 [Chloroflexota bacterium]|nr:cytochrome c oxidase subunit 3 [Chloroflexota bacterium]